MKKRDDFEDFSDSEQEKVWNNSFNCFNYLQKARVWNETVIQSKKL